MTVEWTRAARCEDCYFCGYYRPRRKDGTTCSKRRHKCALKKIHVTLKQPVCSDWQMSDSGEPSYIGHIEIGVLFRE